MKGGNILHNAMLYVMGRSKYDVHFFSWQNEIGNWKWHSFCNFNFFLFTPSYHWNMWTRCMLPFACFTIWKRVAQTNAVVVIFGKAFDKIECPTRYRFSNTSLRGPTRDSVQNWIANFEQGVGGVIKIGKCDSRSRRSSRIVLYPLL